MYCPKCKGTGDEWGTIHGSVVDKLLEVKAAADGKPVLFSSQGQGMSGIEELHTYRMILKGLEDEQ